MISCYIRYLLHIFKLTFQQFLDYKDHAKELMEIYKKRDVQKPE